MKIKLVYKNEEDIPEGFNALYSEVDGEWRLTGVEGMKTDKDTGKLSESLTKARKELKDALDKLAKLGGPDADIDEIVERLDDYDDLKIRADAAGDKIDDAKIEEMVETRVTRRLKPVERERDQLRSQVTSLTDENSSLKGTIATGSIEGRLRELATAEKIVATAHDDVLDRANIFEIDDDGEIVTKEGIRGVDAGITAASWMDQMKDTRPHWWPASEGGGAGGNKGGNGAGSNPWTAKNWDIEAQAAMVKTDRAKAERLAKSAGSTIGSMTPPES